MTQHIKKPLAIVALPSSIPKNIAEKILTLLQEDNSTTDFEVIYDESITSAELRTIEARGVDLGKMNGDPNKPLETRASWIAQSLGRIWREINSK